MLFVTGPSFSSISSLLFMKSAVWRLMACNADDPVAAACEEEDEEEGDDVFVRCDNSMLRTMVTGGLEGAMLWAPVAILR